MNKLQGMVSKHLCHWDLQLSARTLRDLTFEITSFSCIKKLETFSQKLLKTNIEDNVDTVIYKFQIFT